MFCKSPTFYYFSEADYITSLIWYFYTNETKTWDRGLDSYIFCLERKCEIFLKGFYFIEFYAFTWFETILSNCWSHFKSCHGDFNSKL